MNKRIRKKKLKFIIAQLDYIYKRLDGLKGILWANPIHRKIMSTRMPDNHVEWPLRKREGGKE